MDNLKKKKKTNSLIKKKNSDRTSQAPLVEVFPCVDYPRMFEGVFKEGSQIYDVMIKNRLSVGYLLLFCVLAFLLPSGIV